MRPLVLHVFVTSHASVSSMLPGNVAAVSLVAAGAVIYGNRLPPKLAMSAPWLAGGALVGSAFIGTLRMGPYVLIAALSFGLLGVMRGIGGVKGGLARGGLILTAAMVNFACLWPFTFGLYRPT